MAELLWTLREYWVRLRLLHTSKPLRCTFFSFFSFRFLSYPASPIIIHWRWLPITYRYCTHWDVRCHSHRWERRRYFLLLVDTCYIVSGTAEDPLLLRRRSDAGRIEQLLHLLNDTDVLQLTSSVREIDEERLVVRPSISEIFANRGIVELIATFLV